MEWRKIFIIMFNLAILFGLILQIWIWYMTGTIQHLDDLVIFSEFTGKLDWAWNLCFKMILLYGGFCYSTEIFDEE
jgi:hypothetical protein